MYSVKSSVISDSFPSIQTEYTNTRQYYSKMVVNLVPRSHFLLPLIAAISFTRTTAESSVRSPNSRSSLNLLSHWVTRKPSPPPVLTVLYTYLYPYKTSLQCDHYLKLVGLLPSTNSSRVSTMWGTMRHHGEIYNLPSI